MLKSLAYLYILYLLIWFGFSANMNLTSFILGSIFVALILFIFQSKKRLTIHIHLLPLLHLIAFLAWELLISSIEVAYQILRRRAPRSAIITVPLQSTHPLQVSLIALLISLTPGSITVKTNGESYDLLVHIMSEDGSDNIKHFIQEQLEPLIQRTFTDAST